VPRGASPRGLVFGLIGLILAAGCSQLTYYARTAAGGLHLLAARRPIERVLADPDTPPELAERLRLVQRIRRFATRELSLPDDKSYTRYARLDREAAVWTVVAAPELSVEPVEWCFLVVGCVSYRGYFSERRARRFADRLAGEGYDVLVDATPAYSTLGRFADPVLSTFIDLPEPQLAGLLFHELAHRRVFVRGDTAFNESFATAVELAGVERWLAYRGATSRDVEDRMAAYHQRQRRQKELTDLLLHTRGRLAEVFAADRPDGWKRERKAEIYEELRERLPTWARGGSLEPLNNARLASVGAYFRWVDAFERMLAEHEGDFAAFYAEVERLAGLPETERAAALEALGSAAGSGSHGPDSDPSSVGPSPSPASSRSFSRALSLSGSSSSDFR
jgi:predicted aminopeptidase